MNNIAHLFFVGFFSVVALAIVFVKAGQKGGTSGGQQTSQIIASTGTSLSSVASTLEGN